MAYKKLSEATLVESISDVANILIEENDEIKRVPKDELGGCSCPEILETVGGDTLTWDGNTEGLDTYSNVYYRVSDVSPTMNDFVNGGTIKKSDGTIIEFKNYHANEDMGKIDIYMGEIYVFLTEQNGIPAGVYFRNLNGAYVTSFTINGYTGFPKEQVKQEYLPGGGGNAVDVVVDNDNNIIECPLTYGELKEKIESKKPLMITVFSEYVYTSDDMSEITYYLYPAEEILIHYSEGNEGNYISVKCKDAYYLDFRENGEITFYSVD